MRFTQYVIKAADDSIIRMHNIFARSGSVTNNFIMAIENNNKIKIGTKLSTRFLMRKENEVIKGILYSGLYVILN